MDRPDLEMDELFIFTHRSDPKRDSSPNVDYKQLCIYLGWSLISHELVKDFTSGERLTMYIIYLLFWGFALQGYGIESVTQTVEFTGFIKFQSVYLGETNVYSLRTTSSTECLLHCASRQNCTSMYYNRYDGWCMESASAIPVQGSGQQMGTFGWDLYMKKGKTFYDQNQLLLCLGVKIICF